MDVLGQLSVDALTYENNSKLVYGFMYALMWLAQYVVQVKMRAYARMLGHILTVLRGSR